MNWEKSRVGHGSAECHADIRRYCFEAVICTCKQNKCWTKIRSFHTPPNDIAHNKAETWQKLVLIVCITSRAIAYLICLLLFRLMPIDICCGLFLSCSLLLLSSIRFSHFLVRFFSLIRLPSNIRADKHDLSPNSLYRSGVECCSFSSITSLTSNKLKQGSMLSTCTAHKQLLFRVSRNMV